MFDAMLSQLETDMRAALGSCVTELVATARAQLKEALADVAKERTEGLIEVAEERTKALAEVDVKRAELGREIEAMHMHKEAQEGHIALNIGGYRSESRCRRCGASRTPSLMLSLCCSSRGLGHLCAWW
jgi:hypothetical protein